MTLPVELEASVNQLRAKHTALVDAVNAYRSGTINASKQELLTLADDIDKQLTVEEHTLLGQVARKGRMPSLLLDFAKGKYAVGDRRLEQFRPLEAMGDFTRATGGGYWGADGKYKWAGTNTPRIEYDPVTGECLGLLVEEQRTNLLTWSATFDGFTESTTAPESYPDLRARILGATEAPDGTMTATKLVVSNTNANQRMYRSMSKTPGAHTWSLFAKKAELKYIGLRTSSYVNPAAVFDLEAGVELTDAPGARITPYGDGWYRISIPFDPGDNSVVWVTLAKPDAPLSSSTTWQGNGSDGLYIWGGQVEAGGFPTSLIPTESATTTRGKDLFTASVGDWYNQQGGTILTSFTGTDTSVNYGALWGIFTSSAARMGGYVTKSGPNFMVHSGDVGILIVSGYQLSRLQKHFSACSYSPEGLIAAVDGVIGSRSTGNRPFKAATLTLGRSAITSEYIGCAHIHSFAYRPHALTAEELQELTKP